VQDQDQNRRSPTTSLLRAVYGLSLPGRLSTEPVTVSGSYFSSFRRLRSVQFLEYLSNFRAMSPLSRFKFLIKISLYSTAGLQT